MSIHVVRRCFGRRIIGLTVMVALAAGAAAMPTVLRAQTTASSSSSDLDALEKRAIEEGEAGKRDLAIADYKRVLELRPEWKEGWWNLGTLEYSAGRFEEAEGTFRRVTGFAPELGMAWGLLGLSEYEDRRYDAALKDLEKAQAVGITDDAEVKRVSEYHLVLLLIRVGEFERASTLLAGEFGTSAASAQISDQVNVAMGLAVLRVPLLPEAVDPSREALVLAAGKAALGGVDGTDAFRKLIAAYPEMPYLHLASGMTLARVGTLAEAKAMFERETVISPTSPKPWVELSRLAIQEKDREAAVRSAQKAVALGGGDRAAHEAMAEAWAADGKQKEALQEKGIAEQLAGRTPTAEARVVQLYASLAGSSGDQPTKADVVVDQQVWARAMQEYSDGQYARAAEDLKAWLRGSPELGTGWAVLGLCEFGMKDYDNALVHLERGARIGLSGSAESVMTARVTYGLLLVRAGRFEQGAEVLASAHATGGLAERAEAGAGLALLRRVELPGGSEGPDALVTGAGKIELLLEQSKYDEAFPEFKRLLAEYPATPFLHYAYGTALLAMSEFDQAAQEMQAEVKLSPKSELPCVRLASIALRQHKAELATEWGKQALVLAPESVEAHYLLGRAALEAGDEAGAVRELQVASRLSPESPEVHFNLAKAYARANMTEKAERERATFSQLNALAESQRSHNGTQVYAGPHEAGDLSGAGSPGAQMPR